MSESSRMKERKSGFTEAEQMALAWARRNIKPDERTSAAPSQQRRHDELRGKITRGYTHLSAETRRSRSRSRSDCRRKKRSSSSSPPLRRREDGPSYSPYRGNTADALERGRRPSYSPYRGNERRRSFSRSRSRSRSRDKEKYVASWSHDKFSHTSDHSPVRSLPKDYRPPSPTWVSRAGGVAIMKKRTSK